MYLYIHGFNSSSRSLKTQQLREWLRQRGRVNEWHCPDLPQNSDQAIKLLSSLIQELPSRPKLVGSSLGGFYANLLSARFALKAVVINPAIHPARLLKDSLGPQTMWYDDQTYQFTQAHLEQWNVMELPQPANPDKLFLMQEREDEVLDWQEAVNYYRDCHQLVFRGGNHGFSRFTDVLDLFDRF